MKERRQFERYIIALPARMETIISDKKQVFELKTKDISASGAFIDTVNSFSEGTRIKMSLTTQSRKIFDITGLHGLIECEGIIKRSTPTGIAICFDKDCQILSFKDY